MNEEDFRLSDELIGKTDYLLNRLIIALRKKQKDGTWKSGLDIP